MVFALILQKIGKLSSTSQIAHFKKAINPTFSSFVKKKIKTFHHCKVSHPEVLALS